MGWREPEIRGKLGKKTEQALLPGFWWHPRRKMWSASGPRLRRLLPVLRLPAHLQLHLRIQGCTCTCCVVGEETAVARDVLFERRSNSSPSNISRRWELSAKTSYLRCRKCFGLLQLQGSRYEEPESSDADATSHRCGPISARMVSSTRCASRTLSRPLLSTS